MGNDGGSIPDRRDLVRSKPKAEQADKNNQTRARWTSCALSKRPLQEPIVACGLGKLYNKDALLEYLLDRSAYGDGEEICGHIRSLKDVKTLKLTPNPARSQATSASESELTTGPGRAAFVCPLTFKEMNGAQPFVYVATCGCVFSAAGLRAVASPGADKGKAKATDDVPAADSAEGALDLCPQCGTKFATGTDAVALNPTPSEEERMRDAMLARRAAEPVKFKGKKRKAAADAAAAAAVGDAPSEKKAKKSASTPTTNPSIAASSRAVVAGLAMEEAKRKAGMSDAVKSLYTNKDGPQRKETFMTMGTFTRYA